MCKNFYRSVLNGLLLISLFLSVQRLNAQIVTIPDPNFAAALELTAFNSCVTGNQLDVSCVQSHIASGDTVLQITSSSVTDLTGIEYFNGLHLLYTENSPIAVLDSLPYDLDSIIIYNALLTSLPTLPSNLKSLDVRLNQLSSLPALPNGIKYIDASGNQLTGLPVLPSSLLYLYAGDHLLSIPTLPSSLISLGCSGSFSSLPSLPSTLEHLGCSSDLLTSLPALPNSLKYLSCSNSSLTSLPALPASLHTLYCDHNELTSLPALPASMTYLYCSHNHINTLPAFPGGTMYTVDFSHNQLTNINEQPSVSHDFNVSYNLITTLPTFTTDMGTFDCSHNLITSMSNYPHNCTQFSAAYNQLASIPPFDSTIYDYVLDHNLITSLPPFFSTMGHIRIQNNLLTQVDTLPDYIMGFYADSNNISCLPIVHAVNEGVSFWGNPFTCIPSPYYPMYPYLELANYPVCYPGNPGGCVIDYNVTGTIYVDNNSNCDLDSGEASIPDIAVRAYQGTTLVQTVYPVQGRYTFNLFPGTYHIIADTATPGYDPSCPSLSYDTIITVNSSVTTLDFGFVCASSVDLYCNGIPLSGQTFPGQLCRIFPHVAEGWSGPCNTGGAVPGTVTINYSGPYTYFGPYTGSLVPASVTSSTITYNISDFNTVNWLSFASEFIVDTTAAIGDSLCVNVIAYTSLPDVPGNNTYHKCFATHNSFDPNDKSVNQPADLSYPFTDELIYTIRFQNTGTASAINIHVTDILDDDLDVSSFRLLSTSHPVNVNIAGHTLVFSFPNIMLTDSDTDEPNSHGMVQYAIKPLATSTFGTSFENTAHIFFDFNSPITTNTTVNTIIDLTAGVPSNQENIPVNAYPNPTTGKVIISSDVVLNEIWLTDIRGNTCMNIKGQFTMEELDLSHLTSGLYFISVQTEKGNAVRKVILQK